MQPNNTDLLNGFVEKKKAESSYLTLDDGESVRVIRLRDIKMMTKAGFGGEEKEVLRFKCDVETVEGVRTKDFDNGTQRFAQEMQDKGVTIGSAFTLTRTGVQTKTRYTVSDVVNPTSTPAPAPVQPTAVAPVAEVAPVSSPATTAPVAP